MSTEFLPTLSNDFPLTCVGGRSPSDPSVGGLILMGREQRMRGGNYGFVVDRTGSMGERSVASETAEDGRWTAPVRKVDVVQNCIKKALSAMAAHNDNPSNPPYTVSLMTFDVIGLVWLLDQQVIKSVDLTDAFWDRFKEALVPRNGTNLWYPMRRMIEKLPEEAKLILISDGMQSRQPHDRMHRPGSEPDPSTSISIVDLKKAFVDHPRRDNFYSIAIGHTTNYDPDTLATLAGEKQAFYGQTTEGFEAVFYGLIGGGADLIARQVRVEVVGAKLTSPFPGAATFTAIGNFTATQRVVLGLSELDPSVPFRVTVSYQTSSDETKSETFEPELSPADGAGLTARFLDISARFQAQLMTVLDPETEKAQTAALLGELGEFGADPDGISYDALIRGGFRDLKSRLEAHRDRLASFRASDCGTVAHTQYRSATRATQMLAVSGTNDEYSSEVASLS